MPQALEISDDFEAAVVYIAAGGSAFCFKPVPQRQQCAEPARSCACHAFIEPGASFVSTITLQRLK
jgi:hypothetical protein